MYVIKKKMIDFRELQELLNSQQKKFNTNFISKKVEVLVKGKGKNLISTEELQNGCK